MQHNIKKKIPISLATCTYQTLSGDGKQICTSVGLKIFLKRVIYLRKVTFNKKKIIINNILTDALLCDDKKNVNIN